MKFPFSAIARVAACLLRRLRKKDKIFELWRDIVCSMVHCFYWVSLFRYTYVSLFHLQKKLFCILTVANSATPCHSYFTWVFLISKKIPLPCFRRADVVLQWLWISVNFFFMIASEVCSCSYRWNLPLEIADNFPFFLLSQHWFQLPFITSFCKFAQ